MTLAVYTWISHDCSDRHMIECVRVYKLGSITPENTYLYIESYKSFHTEPCHIYERGVCTHFLKSIFPYSKPQSLLKLPVLQKIC